MKRTLNQRGFTVPEVAVAAAIAGMLMVIILGFMTDMIVRTTINGARADLLREAQLTLDAIARDIRLSSGADENNRWEDDYAPEAGDEFSWESSANTVILATAAEDTSRNIIFEDALHYMPYKNNVIYFVSGNNLYKRTLAAPDADNRATTTCPPAQATADCPGDDRLLVHNVTNFTVRYLDSNNQDVAPAAARSLEINLAIDYTKYGQDITAEYTTRTVFRNE